MADELVLIRHAAPDVRRDVTAERWELSAEGRQAARHLASLPEIARVAHVFTSPELKCAATARDIAGDRPVETIELLRELDRSALGWVEPESEYARLVDRVLREPTHSVEGCERAMEAQRRAQLAVEGLAEGFAESTIAVVAGGLLLSLLLEILVSPSEVPADIWPRIHLPDVAVVDLRERQITRRFGEGIV